LNVAYCKIKQLNYKNEVGIKGVERRIFLVVRFNSNHPGLRKLILVQQNVCGSGHPALPVRSGGLK
jgi:hypothetical protein